MFRFLIVIALLCVAPARAADDYLSALQAEANHLEYLGQAREEQKVLERRAREQARAPAVPPAISGDRSSFEQGLREYKGAYVLYNSLPEAQKVGAYNAFKSARGKPFLQQYVVAIQYIIDSAVKAN